MADYRSNLASQCQELARCLTYNDKPLGAKAKHLLLEASHALEAVMTNEAYKHLFESAISALAAIDRELGLPDDGCNATELMIAEIQRLKKLAAIRRSVSQIGNDGSGRGG